MANEVKRKENSPETQPGDQSLPETEGLGIQGEVADPEISVTQTEVEAPGMGPTSEPGVDEAERLLAKKNEELAQANTHLAELEEVISGKDGEIAALKQIEAEFEERVTNLSNSLAEAVSSYKEAVVEANPEVLEELISGDTIEAINESLQQAKALVSKVRQGIEAEISSVKVPAGAPERTPPDFSALSPREKIQQAIGGFSS